MNCPNGNNETITANGYGYRVGKTSGVLEEFLNVSSDKNGYNDVLYFPHTSIIDSCDRYFLASPTYRGYTQSEICIHSAMACVREDSDILVSLSGNTIKAKDIQEGNDIVYYNFNTNTNAVGKVAQKYTHKNAKNFVRYEFDDGSYLEVTDYHPIYTKEGWKSYTASFDDQIPKVGDEVTTLNGYKKITRIKEFTTIEDCYDFAIDSESQSYYYADCYYANNTLVQSDTVIFDDTVHTFTDFKMDCLVSCSYEGVVGRARMDIAESTAAIRPIVVLPTSAAGYINPDGFWSLGELAEGSNGENDDTTAKTPIPQTGEIQKIVLIIGISLIFIGLIFFIRYKSIKTK